jgi:hypothetical protein
MLSAPVLLLCLSIVAAHAHALLDHADPRVGNTVKSPLILSSGSRRISKAGYFTFYVGP